MKIKISELKKMCLNCLTKSMPKEDAELVFAEFLDAELRGRDCHGFQFFSRFAAKVSSDSEGEAEIIKESDIYLYIDGKKNFGQVVCRKFVPKLVKKTKDKGMAMMGIKNMHSYRMPGTYARAIAENDLVGFIFNYGGYPRIVPKGSIDPVFGANPIAVGLPGKEFPIVIDMATSKISMMKIRLAKKLGKKIPEGVAIDKDGNPTTDPTEALDGGILPFGDYKGSALSLMVEILSKTMFDVDEKDDSKPGRGFLFMAFDPSIFQDIIDRIFNRN